MRLIQAQIRTGCRGLPLFCSWNAVLSWECQHDYNRRGFSSLLRCCWIFELSDVLNALAKRMQLPMSWRAVWPWRYKLVDPALYHGRLETLTRKFNALLSWNFNPHTLNLRIQCNIIIPSSQLSFRCSNWNFVVISPCVLRFQPISLIVSRSLANTICASWSWDSDMEHLAVDIFNTESRGQIGPWNR
jgi:hypothetical protein